MISHFFTRPFYIESAAQKRKDLREFRLMLIFAYCEAKRPSLRSKTAAFRF